MNITETEPDKNYTLSLHDALPISLIKERILVIILLLHFLSLMLGSVLVLMLPLLVWKCSSKIITRSEERFSRNAETDLVCRLLLEKKKQILNMTLLRRTVKVRHRF